MVELARAFRRPMVRARVFIGLALAVALYASAYAALRVQPVPALLLPPLLCALLLLIRSARAMTFASIGVAAMLLAFVALGAMSVGWFYLPSAVLVCGAALTTRGSTTA